MGAVANAFMALRDGSNRIADWNALSHAFNIGIVLAEKVGEAEVDVFRNAMQALLRADQTYEAMKAYYFTQADLVDLAKAVTGYGELLKTSSEQKVKAAIAECERRLAAGVHARLPGGIH
jgi:hypothetical protein